MTRDVSPLRRRLAETKAELGCSMADLTVLDTQNDPFRLDTPARHRDGEWFASITRELLGTRPIHLRGIHYMLLGKTKPDGDAYTNTEADWLWLSGDAGKAARWLGYIPFDQITDRRNDAPVVREFYTPDPSPYLRVGVKVDIPDVRDLRPEPYLFDFRGVQPYKLILVGEKSSLDEVLSPVAQRYEADLYLPTGEMSDTLIYRMAKTCAEDGRPARVLYFSDCDPAGWQMPISVARKLQAFTATHFPELQFQVHRVALTPDQVREYELPSTPLKATEKRADRWRTEMGVQQTEIDALASLRPDLLRDIAHAAIKPFFDGTLDQRAHAARVRWEADAGAAVGEALDADQLADVRAQAAARFAELETEIELLNDSMRVAAHGLGLPEVPDLPEPVLSEVGGLPLLDSEWSFAEQCRRLKDSRSYGTGGA